LDTPPSPSGPSTANLRRSHSPRDGVCDFSGPATIWRIHEPPEHKALEQLGAALASYGVALDTTKLEKKPKQRGTALQQLLRALREHPAARPLTYLVLRSLKQACYHVTNRGHFGLASASYLHFTSPIRRYPDLVVHRLVKRKLRADGHPAGGRRSADVRYDRAALQAVAEASSQRERTALDLERQIHSLYAASLMRDRLGDEVEGVVTGFARSGFFVTLDAPAVDGMVRAETLSEYLYFDPAVQRMIARRSGNVIALGDRVRVRVAAANVTRRQIDFELIEHAGRTLEAAPPRGKRQGRRDRGPRARGKGRGTSRRR
jgi:ribonuclease R